MDTPPPGIEFGPTAHGAIVGKFTDRYGASCSVQESSYPDEECVWLGVEVDAMGDPLPSARMHLTREQARQVAETLLYFASEGSLGAYDEGDYRVGGWVIGAGKDRSGVLGRIIEVRTGVALKVQASRTNEVWECAWSLVPSSWLPTEPPAPGPTMFDLLLES